MTTIANTLSSNRINNLNKLKNYVDSKSRYNSELSMYIYRERRVKKVEKKEPGIDDYIYNENDFPQLCDSNNKNSNPIMYKNLINTFDDTKKILPKINKPVEYKIVLKPINDNKKVSSQEVVDKLNKLIGKKEEDNDGWIIKKRKKTNSVDKNIYKWFTVIN